MWAFLASGGYFGSFPPILFLVIIPADTTIHLCGAWDGGPVSAGQARGFRGGAESAVCAESPAQDAIKTRETTSHWRIIARESSLGPSIQSRQSRFPGEKSQNPFTTARSTARESARETPFACCASETRPASPRSPSMSSVSPRRASSCTGAALLPPRPHPADGSRPE